MAKKGNEEEAMDVDVEEVDVEVVDAGEGPRKSIGKEKKH